MNIDINSLFPDLEALTPDGRWNALQDWLAKNPEYGERVEEWSQQPVNEVFFSIGQIVSTRYGLLGVLFLNTTAVRAKLMRAIELLQACYRERQAYNNQQLEKEIKHVRTKPTRRMVKRASKQNQ